LAAESATLARIFTFRRSVAKADAVNRTVDQNRESVTDLSRVNIRFLQCAEVAVPFDFVRGHAGGAFFPFGGVARGTGDFAER
jgi:hypothetical protein